MPASTGPQMGVDIGSPDFQPDVLACRTCGAENMPLHFDSVSAPERVSDLVVRDQGRCISCVVTGQ